MRIKQTVTQLHSCLWLLVVLAEMACGAAPASDQTIYTSTSNQALKQKALQIVQSIRALVDAYNKQDQELLAAYDKKDQPKLKAEARKALRAQWRKDSDAVHEAAMRSYRDQYWAEAILLRNELYRRLPNQPKSKDVAMIYQIPTNMLGIRMIADHLELIAKSLPDS